MAVVAQKGFHFTDFSPTKVVVGMLQFLKFRPLDNQQVAALNLPWPVFDGLTLISDTLTVTQRLTGHALKVYEDHLRFPCAATCADWPARRLVPRDLQASPLQGIARCRDPACQRPRPDERGWHRLSRHLLLRGMASTLVERRVWAPSHGRP